MTCIVGLERDGSVWIGGDSAGVAGWELTIRADSKVFQHGPFLIGFTSSFRMGQLLQFQLQIPEHPEFQDDFEYIATRFVDAVRTCLKDGGFAKKESDSESGGSFLVGYRGRLYRIADDYQVALTRDGFDAVGCGASAALGALFATDDTDPPVSRLTVALEAAEHFSIGVRGPMMVKQLAESVC